MPANQNEPGSRERNDIQDLRDILRGAREAEDAERVHVALIDAFEGLLTHVEKQDRMIEALSSDLSHKQGIVTYLNGEDQPKGES